MALHSNPGPEHVFVDPSTGRFTGIIDFGDAYRSHPALDLRPWRQPADTAGIRAGYQAAGRLPAGFENVVATGLIMGELGQVWYGCGLHIFGNSTDQQNVGTSGSHIQGLDDTGTWKARTWINEGSDCFSNYKNSQHNQGQTMQFYDTRNAH